MNTKTMYEVFWDNFDRLIEQKGVSITKFEQMNGFQIGSTRKTRKGRETIPSWKVVEKICKYFNVYFDEMFWEVSSNDDVQ